MANTDTKPTGKVVPFPIKEVPDDYCAPAEHTQAEKLKHFQAQGIREGIRRQKVREREARVAQDARHEASMLTIKAAHADEIARTAHEARARGFYKGAFLALAFTTLAVVPMTAFATFRIYQSGLMDDVAVQRVPRASPTIGYEHETAEYERGRREPGDAQ